MIIHIESRFYFFQNKKMKKNNMRKIESSVF